MTSKSTLNISLQVLCSTQHVVDSIRNVLKLISSYYHVFRSHNNQEQKDNRGGTVMNGCSRGTSGGKLTCYESFLLWKF